MVLKFTRNRRLAAHLPAVICTVNTRGELIRVSTAQSCDALQPDQVALENNDIAAGGIHLKGLGQEYCTTYEENNEKRLWLARKSAL